MGFDSYAEMIKSREEQMLKDKDLDPDEVKPIVDELVEKRLKDDPEVEIINVHGKGYKLVFPQDS